MGPSGARIGLCGSAGQAQQRYGESKVVDLTLLERGLLNLGQFSYCPASLEGALGRELAELKKGTLGLHNKVASDSGNVLSALDNPGLPVSNRPRAFSIAKNEPDKVFEIMAQFERAVII